MKKQKAILILALILPLTLISFLSLTPIDGRAAPTPLDWGTPAPGGRYWDFDNNTIVGWQVDGDVEPYQLIYNISSMKYLKNVCHKISIHIIKTL